MSDPKVDQTAAASNGTATTPITPEGMIIAYTGLYTMAMFCICYGSYLSAALIRKRRREKKFMENSITFKDARYFPVTASCVLFGLYCLFRRKECLALVLKLFRHVKIYAPVNLASKIENFLIVASSNISQLNNATGDNSSSSSFINEKLHNVTFVHNVLEMFTKENISYFLLIFFCFEGVFALAHLLKPIIVWLIRPQYLKDKLFGRQISYYRLSFTKSPLENVNHDNVKENVDETEEPRKQYFDCTLDSKDIFSIMVCCLIGICHVTNRNWLSNNAFGLAFTLYGIEELHLSSFKAGAVLLAGLFVYDVFWVFATDVMSTVATTINAPILLMFPQDLLTNGFFSSTKFAMLGLGDIVIPGIFLALLLRYGEKYNQKIYFYFTVVAYACGLMLTILVMHYFKARKFKVFSKVLKRSYAAQPALLYLVPACLGAPLFLALLKGQVGLLWNYDEADIVKPEKPEKKDAKKMTKSD
uniref:Uncharacterized protein n=1 Tax=Romanomermis culicivorax TaxID=13658 RepID=A0A915IQ06_ROMCU